MGQRKHPFTFIKSHVLLQLVEGIAVDMVTLQKKHAGPWILEDTFDQFKEPAGDPPVLLLGKHLVIEKYFYGWLPGKNSSSNWR